MKTLKTILAAVAIAFTAMTASAQSMSYEAMRNNARFLTDRMAYELGIHSMGIIDDIYRINFDYICGVNEYLDEIALGYFYDEYAELCARRDYALRALLGDLIWNRLLGFNYFYRPIVFADYRWHFSIYDFDRYGVHHYFYREPRHFRRHYAGGHFFHGMAPAGGHIHRPVPQPHRDGAMGGPRPGAHPQGGNIGNRPQPGGNDRPRGGNIGNRPQSGSNDRPQGGSVANRPQSGGNDRPQGGTVNRGQSSRSDSNMRSSSRGGSSRSTMSSPSRSGASRASGGSSLHGGGARGGRR